MVHNRDKLWVKIFYKYCSQIPFMQIDKAQESLLFGVYQVSTIIKGKNFLKAGFTFRIGSGETSFWYEAWLNEGPL